MVAQGIGAVYMKGGLEGPLADGNRLEPFLHGASQVYLPSNSGHFWKFRQDLKL